MEEYTPQKKDKFVLSDYMKRYVYVFSLALLLILGTSYGLTFFKQNMKIGEISLTVGGLTTNVTADKTISLANLEPVADSEGISLNSKEITITNTSSLNGEVSVTLERTSGLELTDLRYALYVNGVLETIANMPSSGRIFTDAILSNEVIDIKVSLWVKDTYTGSVKTFEGELEPELSLGSYLGSSYIKDLSGKTGSNITENNGNYTYTSSSTNNYVNFNCNNGTCEKWRIVGVEDGRLVLTTDTYFGNTFTNSNKFNETLVLNDYSLVTSMSTDNHAVYLNKTVKIVGGNGTSSNPYILEDDSVKRYQDKKVIATLTYNNEGTTTTQPIYKNQTNYISQVVDDTGFKGWSTTSGGTVSYQLGDTISFTSDTTLYAVIKYTLNQKVMKLCNDPNVSYVQKYNADANGAAIDDYQGLGNKDVCYFTSTLTTMDENDPARQNSNVIFGDYCWQIVRTTATGGVKLVYNGHKVVVDGKDICPYATSARVNDTTGFVGTTGTQKTTMTGSKTYGKGFTYSGTTFTLTDTFTATWSESDANSNGIPDYKELIGTYVCGTSSSPTGTSNTCTTLYYIGHYQSATQASTTKYTIGTLAHYSQIGTTSFNAYTDSPALVGYMYNDVYNVKSETMTTKNYNVLTYTSSMTSKTLYYGDSAVWNGTGYDLKMNGATPTSKTAWATIYARGDEGVGLYTCLDGTRTCATVEYIEGTSSSTMYSLHLSNNQTKDDPYIVVSSTYSGSSGNYSLGTPETFYLKDFYSNGANVNYKYMCSDTQSNSNCSTIWHIGGVRSYLVQYVPSTAAEYTFANDVSYSGGVYTLTAPFITTWDWPAIYNGINSNHYTCFGDFNSSTNSCGSSVYYINYTDGTTAYYAILKGVANIETALKQMINYGSGADANINKYDSSIKGLIDNWYAQNIDANNLTQYLEDAVYCNDRSVTSTSDLGGWLKTGLTDGSNAYLKFKNYSSPSKATASLSCVNLTDRFSADDNNTLANLKYTVGLLTEPERAMMYQGYVRTGRYWWLASPYGFSDYNVGGRNVGSTGSTGTYSVIAALGARPAVSLAPDTEMTGDGTYDSPYIVTVN